MDTDQVKAKNLLKTGNYTCVFCKGDSVITETERGLAPLLKHIQSGTDLKGYAAADKVVGKAPAMLYALLGIKSIYAQVMSAPGYHMLSSYCILAPYGELVDNILNEDRTDICPMEKLVKDTTLPEDALKLILEKIS